jgi:peptide/nickel transport system substrate-binding protein
VGALVALGALPADAGKADNSLHFVSEQVPPNIDPYFNNLVLGTIVADNVWDSLLSRNPATGAIEPNLATSWRWIDDRTLELDLREGVRFHDGAPFGADDVVYTLTFVANPSAKIARPDGVVWIEHVEKVTDHRVRIHTKLPYPAAITVLAAPAFVIHPHRYYAQVGPQGMNARPIGTGPYRVAEHALNKRIVLERNDAYFAGGPKAGARIATVEIRLIRPGESACAAHRSRL